ncbi:MAG: hypothetical protein ACQKBT_11685, partial [Puniceicoccales bacterium]
IHDTGEGAPAFLDASLGGTNYGYGTTLAGQEAYREFQNNTVGLDVGVDSYSISLYTGLNFSESVPASGRYHIYNGNFGANFGHIRVGTEGESLAWEAYDNTAGWQEIGISLATDKAYYIEFVINTAASNYDITVSQVNTDGSVVESGSLVGLEVGHLNPNEYGKLGFHLEASAGTANFAVDNINISSVPEPEAFAAVMGLGFLAITLMRRKR